MFCHISCMKIWNFIRKNDILIYDNCSWVIGLYAISCMEFSFMTKLSFSCMENILLSMGFSFPCTIFTCIKGVGIFLEAESVRLSEKFFTRCISPLGHGGSPQNPSHSCLTYTVRHFCSYDFKSTISNGLELWILNAQARMSTYVLYAKSQNGLIWTYTLTARTCTLRRTVLRHFKQFYH